MNTNNRPWRLTELLLALCILGMAPGICMAADDEEKPAEGAAAEKTAAETAEDEAAPRKRWVHGSFDVEFDGYREDGHGDGNLSQALELRADPPAHPRLHLRGLLWMHEDLDSDESRSSALRSINDAYDADLRARLLHLYAELDDLWRDSTLRLGRQRLLEGTAWNRFDGLYFAKRHARVNWYVFGGVRASVYEDRHDEPVVGGGVSVRPFRATRLALDFYYGEEHRDRDDLVYRYPVGDGAFFSRHVKRKTSDTKISLSLWQQITYDLQFFGRFSWLEGDGNELQLAFTGYLEKLGLSYELDYRHQSDTAGDRMNDITAFYRILGEYGGFDAYLAALHKSIGKRLTVSLEAEFHDARHDGWGTANRDYERYALVLAMAPLFKQVDASIALERWDVDDGERTWALTGELSRAWKRLTVTAGADYERYEDRLIVYRPLSLALDDLSVAVLPGVYPGDRPFALLSDTWAVTTHENIYSIYAKAKWAFAENQDLSLGVTYEDADGAASPFWRFQAGYAIRF